MVEGPPARFRFTEGDTHTEDDLLAFGGDAQGDEHGAVAELAVVGDFFVAGVESQMGTGTRRTVAPFLRSGVPAFGTAADRGGAAGGAAELPNGGGDLAGAGAFVRLGLEHVMAFDAQGFVNEEAQALGETVVTLVGPDSAAPQKGGVGGKQDKLHKPIYSVAGQVPEPRTGALLTLGMGLLGWRTWRGRVKV